MCGIAGVSWARHRPSNAAQVLDRMVGAIEHRGPDSEGRSSNRFADVGFRRLSIIDLSGGTQPLSNEDGTIDCFLNGEIYNYRDLRRELIARGHTLHTESDTEVLPHLYEEYGERMFAHLNGMFIVCVVDRARQRVLLARDHFGVKQMYYAVTGAGVVFGSELKAVLAARLFEPEIDRASLLPYLTMFYTPEPHTLIKGVMKIPPGCLLRLNESGRPEVHRYYELPVPTASRTDLTEAAAHTSRLLTQAVKLQLQADVPVGISLSGGVDSSALTGVAALASASGPRPVALTISWPDTDPAELSCAKELCRRYGIEHEVLEPPSAQPLDELLTLAWVSDEPIADPALYSQLCIASAAARRVKVLLSGAGGDELFGGYGSYHPSWKRTAFMLAPRLLQQFVAVAGADRWLGSEELEAMIAYRDSRLLWHSIGKSNLTRAAQRELRQTLVESRDPLANLRALFEEYRCVDPLNQQMLVDLRTYLPDQILPMVDRATMASSVEGRVPFLDVPTVEFAFSISGRAKMGFPLVAKRLLKKAIEPWIPKSIIERKKIGMPSPFPLLIARERMGLVRALLLGRESYVRSLFSANWIESLIATDDEAARNFRVLYSLLILEVWYRRFIRDRDYSRPTQTIHDLLGSAGAHRSPVITRNA
jgi:asparagine synthase (glutamine-hydrolysing)